MQNKAIDNPNNKIISLPYTFFIGVMLVFFVLIITDSPFNGKYCAFVTAFLGLILGIIYVNKISFKLICWLLLFCIVIFISSVIHASGREYMISLMAFMIVLLLNSRLKILTSSINFYYAVFVIINLSLILFAPMGNKQPALIPNSVFDNVNPNTSGMYMMFLYVTSICFAIYSRKRIGYLIVALISLVSIELFKARTSLLGALIFTVLLVLFRFVKFERKNSLIIFLCAFGILFAYIYSVTLYDLIGPGKIYILGKDIFSGREIIWQAAFNRIKGHYWFGIGNTITEGDEFSSFTANLHNQFVGIMVIFGLPTFIVASFAFVKFTNSLTNNKQLYHVFYAFTVGFVVMNYTEIVMFTINLIVSLAVLYALVIAKQENYIKRKNL